MENNYRMVCKQNPETRDWLCHIPKTGIAYYLKGKNKAHSFCDSINLALIDGRLYIDNRGNLKNAEK